ncbi:hypothetical protein PE067_12380 [Paracoccus sp. DMF-8]|uniref:hypothetical protein n=1 Tax=Paracoccus sp. DMF-8 TaxID=3019445 RepID=UPI0023E78720|nr:hypothetical protein [Paracoccus sp. DMF-8]MDF3606854.1 hypothetical protein [Paracoccus sp. DMF-8]
MKKKILFVILALAALAGGAAGGMFLKPQKEATQEQAAGEPADTGKEAQKDDSETELTWFKFPTQFFVPLMQNGQVSGTMILSLVLELPQEATERINAQEHRLRDALLRALMIRANTGGFNGNFTSDVQMQELRAVLLAAAQEASGTDVRNVLVEDIARQ